MLDMKLSELTGQNGDMDAIEITGLALDSRGVEPGFLFAALKGSNEDGAKYIPDALERGAVAVLTGMEEKLTLAGMEEKLSLVDAVHVIEDNPRKALAKIAAKYFAKQPKIMAAVTGTNGKTSVASFTHQFWTFLGKKAASIGTPGVVTGEKTIATGLTTPDPIVLHKALQNLAKARITHAVMEASSHGLSQHRLDGVKLKVAAFTNLTQDHLDYHKDEKNYFAAKRRLFDELLPKSGTAVINTNDPFGKSLAQDLKIRGRKVISLGPELADIELVETTPAKGGQTIKFVYDKSARKTWLPMAGDFQAQNALLAAGIVIASGFEAKDVFPLIEKLEGVPGRMELAGEVEGLGEIYIDYAHTPDGLARALASVRKHTKGAIHVVFGCGGDRDAGKRAKMGAIANNLSEHVYVTDDNPRSEDPAKIRKAILAGCPGGQEFDDRAKAIGAAIAAMEQGDVVIITGKGIETGQIIGDEVIPFSDHKVVKETLKRGNA